MATKELVTTNTKPSANLDSVLCRDATSNSNAATASSNAASNAAPASSSSSTSEMASYSLLTVLRPSEHTPSLRLMVIKRECKFVRDEYANNGHDNKLPTIIRICNVVESQLSK